MITKRLFLKLLIVLIGLGLFISCGEETKTDLTPKGTIEEEVILEETETITVDNVRITVQSDAWKGDPAILEEVTPLKLSVENNNPQPIKVTYENLKLISKENDVYSALPIYEVEGNLEDARLAEDYEVIVRTDIDYNEFYIYPMYTRVYTDVPVTDYKFYENPEYYVQFYKAWDETGLPTNEMKIEALPEGILMEGGSLSGFVYFEKVDPELEEVEFRMKLINAETNEVFGSIEIPFWVMLEVEKEN